MTVLLPRPDYLLTASKPVLQPVRKSAMALPDSIVWQQAKLPPMPSYPAQPELLVARAAAKATLNADNAVYPGRKIALVSSGQPPLTTRDMLLDTASELHLGLGPFQPEESNTFGDGSASNHLLPSSSVIPGQVLEQDTW